ncbi:hypothetical protein ABZ639_11455 [Saccharomonospora sp. NPDC006951]
MTADPDQVAELRARRAEFRRYVRENHPDVGGDPDEFIAGIARFREETTSAPSERDRFEAPVVFTSRPSGITGAAVRVARWWRKRRRPPRVR